MLKQFEVQNIYIGEYVKHTTFTISWTEKSDMSSGWTYSDDAAGLTAGSTAFDDFFGYYGCRLNTSGVETAKVTQEESGGAGKLDITQLGTLTSGDNVMIAFPRRGIKMSKSGTQVTLSITDDPHAEGYQYYAHSRGGSIKDKFYLGAYKGTGDSSKVTSLSGASPYGRRSIIQMITSCKANGTNYNLISCWQRWYINALYMMKYGNPNSQSVVGMGYVGGSAKVNTGGTNSQTNATYGTTSNIVQCKLFGLEDRWGNMAEWCDLISNNKVKIPGDTSHTSTGVQTGTGNYISGICGTNIGMFMPSTYTSSNSYYCDYGFVASSSTSVAYSGGSWNGGNSAGALYLDVNLDGTSTPSYVGARLMYV